MLIELSPNDISKLLDRDNQASLLVLAHLVAIYLMMRPLSCRERLRYTATMYSIRMTYWIDGILENVQSRYIPFMEWPLVISSLNKARTLEQEGLVERA